MSAEFSPTNFKQWLQDIGKSEATAKNYSGAINTLSQMACDKNLTSNSLYTIDNPNQFHRVSKQIQQLPAFKQKNNVGKGMYSAALNKYAEFLGDISGQQLKEDVEQILSDETIPVTDRVALVNTRLGQGKFRSQLIEQWQGCAVTGYRNLRFLVASHIKPWSSCSDSERLDPNNGLLLLPNLDKVFDLGYISFAETGKICISSQLEDINTLGVTPDLRVSLSKQRQEFMAYHRDVRFQR